MKILFSILLLSLDLIAIIHSQPVLTSRSLIKTIQKTAQYPTSTYPSISSKKKSCSSQQQQRQQRPRSLIYLYNEESKIHDDECISIGKESEISDNRSKRSSSGSSFRRSSRNELEMDDIGTFEQRTKLYHRPHIFEYKNKPHRIVVIPDLQ